MPSHVKTSLAPGSRVVTDYLGAAGLLAPLAELGFDVVGCGDGAAVYLRDIWPSNTEIAEVVAGSVSADQFAARYRDVFSGNPVWSAIEGTGGTRYGWEADSTYIQEPPFFADLGREAKPLADIAGARALLVLGDSITTDHISPAGSIPADSPAGRYLLERGVARAGFNSYGSRRGNHEVMMRGTFANIRIKNLLAAGTEGGVTEHQPSGERMPVFDAAVRYRGEGVPLIVLAGQEYGSGSSRDWAAKGPALLGVKAVIAQSYERIHRANLVGMGVLPLQFQAGESAAALGLSGRERFDVAGLAGGVTPGQQVTVTAAAGDGAVSRFTATVRVDTALEAEYLASTWLPEASGAEQQEDPLDTSCSVE